MLVAENDNKSADGKASNNVSQTYLADISFGEINHLEVMDDISLG